MIEFVRLLSILTKFIGTEPRARPVVVMPKAKPGFSGKADTRIANVIAMVILKNITPASEMYIFWSPKMRNGIAASMLM